MHEMGRAIGASCDIRDCVRLRCCENEKETPCLTCMHIICFGCDSFDVSELQADKEQICQHSKFSRFTSYVCLVTVKPTSTFKSRRITMTIAQVTHNFKFGIYFIIIVLGVSTSIWSINLQLKTAHLAFEILIHSSIPIMKLALEAWARAKNICQSTMEGETD